MPTRFGNQLNELEPGPNQSIKQAIFPQVGFKKIYNIRMFEKVHLV